MPTGGKNGASNDNDGEDNSSSKEDENSNNVGATAAAGDDTSMRRIDTERGPCFTSSSSAPTTSTLSSSTASSSAETNKNRRSTAVGSSVASTYAERRMREKLDKKLASSSSSPGGTNDDNPRPSIGALSASAYAERRMRDKLASKVGGAGVASSSSSSSSGNKNSLRINDDVNNSPSITRRPDVVGSDSGVDAAAIVPGAVSVPGDAPDDADAATEVRGRDAASSSSPAAVGDALAAADAAIAIPDATLVVESPEEDVILTVTADVMEPPSSSPPPKEKCRDAICDKRVLIVLSALAVTIVVIVTAVVVVAQGGSNGDDGGDGGAAATNGNGNGQGGGSSGSQSPSSVPTASPSAAAVPPSLPPSSTTAVPFACPAPLRYSRRILPIGHEQQSVVVTVNDNSSAVANGTGYVLDAPLYDVVEAFGVVVAIDDNDGGAIALPSDSVVWLSFKNGTDEVVGELVLSAYSPINQDSHVLPGEAISSRTTFDPPLHDVTTIELRSDASLGVDVVVTDLFVTTSTHPYPIPIGHVAPFTGGGDDGAYEYKINDAALTFDEHVTAAREWGGDLASVHSNEEHDFVRSMMESMPWGTAAYLGGKRNYPDDPTEWIWTDGTPFDYHDEGFCPGEPNNLAENVIEMSSEPGCWNDDGDTNRMPAVYKRPTVTRLAYEYKLSDATRSWNEHRLEAMGWGGDLVSIRSAEENVIVASFLEGSSSSSVTRAYLGAKRNEHDRSQWEWSDGRPWGDYTNYCPGEPNDVGAFEDVLEISTSVGCRAGWNDLHIDVPIHAIYMRSHPFFNGYEYRISDSPLSWDEHRTKALEWGGDLASILSQDEEEFIRSLAGPSLTQLFVGGKRDPADPSQWIWSDGSEWEYTNFCPEQPDNYAAGDAVVEEGVIELATFLPGCSFGWNDQRNSAQNHAVYKRIMYC